MLERNKVIRALEKKRPLFEHFFARQVEQRQQVNALLAATSGLSAVDCRQRLDASEIEHVGALPTDEWDHAAELQLPFGEQWRSHEGARAWALTTLRDRPVLAVDGSQLMPTKDVSLPVGAIQIAWFVNPHRAGGGYIKDVAFEVLAPEELGEDVNDVEGGLPSWRVNQERFVRETEKLCELMEGYASRPPEERPLCFFDGSFVVSFAGQIRPQRARHYIRAVAELLDCSTRFEVPLVGFIDSSFSRDLVTMLGLLAEQAPARHDGQLNATSLSDMGLSDAGLISSAMRRTHGSDGAGWGCRTPLFICDRSDELSRDGRAPFYRDVTFTYVKLVRNRPPARLELPRWLHEAGRVEEIVDLVRAECIVGTGYPYAIEAADAAAVISQRDRQHFYSLFQQFAGQLGHDLTITRKAQSKRVRR